eukprot:jgi/Tetstr1/429244/TSEL_001907.t1
MPSAEPPFESSQPEWTAFDSVQTTLRLWSLVLPLAFGGVSLFGEAIGVSTQDMASDTKALASCTSQAVQLAGTLWILRRVPPVQRPPASFSLMAVGAGAAGGGGAVLCVACVLGAGSIVNGGGVDVPGQAELLQNLSAASGPVLALLAVQTVVLGPITEELIYRGFLLNQLLQQLPRSTAVLTSAALFAGAHFSPSQFPPLLALGLVLGGVFASTRNVVPVVAAHGIYNAFALMALAATEQLP